MDIKISVVVIAYNQAEKIQRCLDSLLRSNYKDFEVIIADDCSLDSTRDVVRLWMSRNASEFSRVHLVENKKNVGTVSNISTGIKASRGVFIKLIAGDDWFCDGAFDILKNFIENNSFDIAFCPVYIALENQQGEIELTGRRLEASKKQNFFLLSPAEQYNELVLLNLLPAPGSFFTRAYWDSIQFEGYGFKISEDWPMWVLGALNKFKFVKIDEPLVFYLRHKNSITCNIDNPFFRIGIADTLKMYELIVFPNKDRLSLRVLVKAWMNYFALVVLMTTPDNIVNSILNTRRKLQQLHAR